MINGHLYFGGIEVVKMWSNELISPQQSADS